MLKAVDMSQEVTAGKTKDRGDWQMVDENCLKENCMLCMLEVEFDFYLLSVMQTLGLANHELIQLILTLHESADFESDSMLLINWSSGYPFFRHTCTVQMC